MKSEKKLWRQPQFPNDINPEKAQLLSNSYNSNVDPRNGPNQVIVLSK